jgi:hypothetical protein
MRHQNFELTPTMTSAPALLKSLAALKAVDAELFKTATTPTQRNAVRRAASRRRTLKRAISRWLSGETRAQRGLFPLGGGWED